MSAVVAAMENEERRLFGELLTLTPGTADWRQTLERWAQTTRTLRAELRARKEMANANG